MNYKKILNPLEYYRFFKRKKITLKMKSVGRNFSFDYRSTIMTPQFMEVGNNVFIGELAHISADLIIQDNVMFGPRPVILGGNHMFGIFGQSPRFLKPKGRENVNLIVIEKDAWIGANSTILDGVTVGFGCVVGAGSVVSKSLPPFTICVGNPCKPIKKIFSDKKLFGHLSKIGVEDEKANKIINQRGKYLLNKNLIIPEVDNS